MGNKEKEELIEAVLQYGIEELENASEELLGNKEFISELVKVYDGDYQDVLEYASEEIQADQEFISELSNIKENLKSIDEEYAYMSESLLEDNTGNSVKYVIDKEKYGDKDYILKLIGDIGSQALKYASEELKEDIEVVLEAVEDNGYALEYASEKLKRNREVVLTAVKNNGEALKFANEELRGDYEVVLTAVKSCAKALEYASEELRGNREIVLEAVKENEDALEFASEELRGNKDFFLDLLIYTDIYKKEKEHELVWKYAGGSLSSDNETALEVIKLFGISQLKGVSPKLLENKEFILDIFNEEDIFKCNNLKVSEILPYINEEFLKDKDFVLRAVQSKNDFMEYEDRLEILENAGKEVFEDKEFVLELIEERGGSTLEFASEELRGDREVVLKAVREDGYALAYASEELRGDKQIVIEAFKENEDALEFASEELRADKEFMLEAVRENDNALAYASEELRGDKQIVIEALSQNSGKHPSEKEKLLTTHVSPELQNDPQILELLELVKERENKKSELNKKIYTANDIANSIEPIESMIKDIKAEMIKEMEKTTEQTKDTQGHKLDEK